MSLCERAPLSSWRPQCAVVAIGCGTTKTAGTGSRRQLRPRQAPPHEQPQLPTIPSDPAKRPPGRRRRSRRGRGGAGGAAQAGAPNPQPYDRVVTAQAQTKNGLFKVHRIGERLLFEIPRREMNKDILLVQEIAQTALGAGYDGQAAGNRVLRFERRDNRVLLRGISNEIMASDTTVAGRGRGRGVERPSDHRDLQRRGVRPGQRAGDRRLASVHAAADGAVAGAAHRRRATRSTRRVRGSSASASFPDNVNVYSTLTLAAGGSGGRGAAAAGGRGGGRGGAGFTRADGDDRRCRTASTSCPTTPMEPRLCDNRVGYFSLTVTDYAGDDSAWRATQRCFITRYRLEKKDPSAAISDPVKPIVYYLDANTPVKWRP